MEERWRDPHWLADAMDWVDRRLVEAGRPRTGDPDQVHVRPWATAIKVPTDRGPVWFKANTEELVHEVLVTHLVAQRVPDRVPPLIADDPDRGWLLMDDAGTRLREVIAEERDLSRWIDVLDGAADIARAMEPDVDRLVAAGVPRSTAGGASRPVRRAGGVRRRRRAVPRRRPPGPRDGRGARVVRRARDAPARRPPRRAGVREGRPAADPGLGGRPGVAPVLHLVGDPRGRDRLGSGRRGELGRHRAPGRGLSAALRTGPPRLRRRDPGRAAARLGLPGHVGTTVEDPRSTKNRLTMFLDGRL